MAQQKKKRRRNRHDPDRARVAAQREEARRRQREERRRAAMAQQRKDQRMSLVKRWSRMALVGAGVTAAALWFFWPDSEVEGVTVVPEIRAVPLAEGQTVEYGTSTPTSGEYREDAQACGVFDEEITTEAAATAVYYGAVVLWYSPDLPAADREALIAAASAYDSHVVVSPQEGLEAPIVATAWRRLMAYDTAAGVDEFIDTYRMRSPGDGDCPIGG
ncbi:MAG: DUF3105 domain-containing protein [Actinobacteria bacterium]|nr:DUF3105 domain-containing protein [Actinomycetota bacterium]